MCVCVCVCVCVFFLNFVSLLFFFFFFYSRNSSTYFKVLCQSLQKNSDRTRSLAVSILEYNLGPKITGSEVQSGRKRFVFLKEERNSAMIHR